MAICVWDEEPAWRITAGDKRTVVGMMVGRGTSPVSDGRSLRL